MMEQLEKLKPIKEHSHKFWDEFKEFAMKGNVMDLAIGVVIGTAFSSITNSLVKDIIMPPLGLLLKRVDFSNLYINLSGKEYPSLAAAQAAGAATINYGIFLNNLINFFIIAFVIFLVVKQINHLRHHKEQEDQAEEANIRHCPFCVSEIPLAATRCPACTSQLTHS